jgi:hypothetical protein
MTDNDADADNFWYPQSWTPKGAPTPERPGREPTDTAARPISSLRSGCPDPLAGDRRADDYPQSWKKR